MLGSGLVAAQTINLDKPPNQPPDPGPIFAVESLSNDKSILAGGVRYFELDPDGGNSVGHTIQVTSKAVLDADDDYFMRVALNGGLVFSDFDHADLVVGGQPADSVAVISLGAVGTDTPQSVDLNGHLAVASAEPGSYTATISLHESRFEAYEGVGQVAASLFGGTAPIVQTTSGILAEITPDDEASVAEVTEGFLWFSGPIPSADLGTVKVIPRNLTGTTSNVLSARDGGEIDDTDLIASDGVTIDLEGNLGIGVWSFKKVGDIEGADLTGESSTPRQECPPFVGGPTNPVDRAKPGTVAGPGAVIPDKDDPDNMGTAAMLSAGVYMLCVTVDTAGMGSNQLPIPEGGYMATVKTLAAGGDSRVDTKEVASGLIGSIVRNGASVKVGFLTTAEKYNQRLIVVNHGSRSVAITNIEVNVQDDVEGFEVMGDPAELMIGPGEMKVYLVADVLEIMGRNRASGTLSFNGAKGDISVATTIVNREDGSTDTVMWPVN